LKGIKPASHFGSLVLSLTIYYQLWWLLWDVERT